MNDEYQTDDPISFRTELVRGHTVKIAQAHCPRCGQLTDMRVTKGELHLRAHKDNACRTACPMGGLTLVDCYRRQRVERERLAEMLR